LHHAKFKFFPSLSFFLFFSSLLFFGHHDAKQLSMGHWQIYTNNPGKKKKERKRKKRNMAGKEYNTANPYLKHPIEE